LNAAASIAAALGNAHAEGNDWRCDCPVCHRHNLTLSNGNKQLLVKCFNGCAASEVLAALRQRDLYKGKKGNGADPSEPQSRAEHEGQAKSAKAKRKARIDAAVDIWRNSYPAADTMVATYLASRLLLDVSPTLRFVPALWHKQAAAKYPAMVGLVEHADEGAVGIHAVFLNPLDASVRVTIEPRKWSLGPIKGGAVRLAPAGAVLAIAEGIEDALTFMQATGIPSWAAITASGIRNFVPPPLGTTATLILVEDNDANKTGQKAVADAARRLAKKGYTIKIARPSTGKDINEALLKLGLCETLFTLEDFDPESADGDCLSGTEDAVAFEFSSRHATSLRYVNLWHRWLRWDGARWLRVDDLSVFHKVRLVAREFAKMWDDKRLGKDAATAAIERTARNDPRHDTPADAWDADLETFNMSNNGKT
jgi:hypothetical protein